MFPDMKTIKVVCFEKLRVAVQGMLSEEGFAARHMELDVRVDPMLRCLVMSLKTYVLGKKEGRVDVEEKWPQDWWQAFRERWLPKW